MDRFRVEDRRMYRSHGRFWTDASREKIVAEDSPEAAFLLTTENTLIPLADAVAFGMCDKNGNPKDPLTGKKEKVDSGEVEDKMKRGPGPANAPGKKIEKLTDVRGIAEATAAKLAEHGVESPDDFLAAEVETLTALEIPSMTEAKIADIKRQIQESQAVEGDPEPAEVVSG